MPDTPSAGLVAGQTAIVTPGTTYFLGFNTADPGGTGASEGTAGRQSIVFAAPSGGTQTSTTAQAFTNVPGSQTYTYFSVWTAATAGTYVRGGQLFPPITPPAGSTVDVAAGGITFTIA